MPGRLGIASVEMNQGEHEHRVQLNLMDSMCKAMAEHSGGRGSEELIEQLLSFSEVHFMSEHLLMRLSSYPELESHCADHDRFIEAIGRLMTDWRADRRDDLAARAEDLRDGLQKHIASRDAQFYAYHERWLQKIGR